MDGEERQICGELGVEELISRLYPGFLISIVIFVI